MNQVNIPHGPLADFGGSRPTLLIVTTIPDSSIEIITTSNWSILQFPRMPDQGIISKSDDVSKHSWDKLVHLVNFGWCRTLELVSTKKVNHSNVPIWIWQISTTTFRSTLHNQNRHMISGESFNQVMGLINKIVSKNLETYKFFFLLPGN